MIKKIMVLLLVLVVVFSMTACSDKENNSIDDVTTEASLTEEETTLEEIITEAEKAEEETAEVVLTGWEDLDFELAGIPFSVPFKAGELGSNGWVISGLEDKYDTDYVLKAGEKLSNVYMITNADYNSDVRTLVGFVNSGTVDAKVTECDVWSFVCNIYDETNGVLFENVPDIKLANGITWGSTPEEIKSAYGESLKDIEGEADDYTVHMYMYNDGLNIMKLTTRENLGLVEIVLLGYNEI